MIEILGNSTEKLPIRNLQKISDLIEYDGPILSHFKDDKGRNFLFYWVDFNSDHNRWLVWKISELQLYNYLLGITSLRDILLDQNKEFIYVVDIDSDLKYENIKMVLVDDLNEEYTPEEESFIKSDKLQEYNDLVEKYQSSEYLAFLRKNSIYFTLEPSSYNFATTISAIDASNFLKKISSSFLGFIEYDFYNSFKNSISDVAKLNKIIRQFKDLLTPRVVDLQFSSFKVALSADTIQSVGQNSYKTWQHGILDKYKDEVIEIDLNSESVLRNIAEKYPIEARKNIYNPIVEIINDKNYKLKISDHKRRVIKKFQPIEKRQVEILIPKEEIMDTDSQKKILLNLIVEVTKNDDIRQLGKRELQSGLLFTQEVNEFHISFESMESSSFRVMLRKPINCDIQLEGNKYKLSLDEFPVKVEAQTIDEAKKLIQRSFIEFYLDSQESPANYNSGLHDKLNSVVEKIIKL